MTVHSSPEQAAVPAEPGARAEPGSFTRPSPQIRRFVRRNFPLDKLLPDREPSYVSSSLYTAGVLTLAALIVCVASGVVLALGGVSWWHTNSLGGFVNSVHFWSVQAMFLFMAVHFIFNFFIQAWRGGRGWTWITGVLAFILAILTAFTGFLMMTNWDSQWIGQQAKDAFNALGIGSVWNVMNAGQQFTMHVVVTVGLLLIVVVMHLGLVRRRGVVPPPGAEELEVADGESASVERGA